MPETITQAELIAQAIDTRLRDLHVALPCKVKKVNLATQKVDVEPVISRAVPKGEDDAPVIEKLPVIQSVPLVFPRGGGFFLSVPVQVGDYVLCIFSERDIGLWMSTGNAGSPGDQRMHSLAGAMAIPGIFPNAQKLSDASGSNMVLGKDGGINVTITSARMEVDGATDAAALASKVKQLETDFINHVHATAGTGTPSTPIISGVPPVPKTYDSTKLKVGG